eukprot:4940751-Prymnesium_polylepis.1
MLRAASGSSSRQSAESPKTLGRRFEPRLRGSWRQMLSTTPYRCSSSSAHNPTGAVFIPSIC